MTQGPALRCIGCVSTLVATHWNASLGSTRIVFPRCDAMQGIIIIVNRPLVEHRFRAYVKLLYCNNYI